MQVTVPRSNLSNLNSVKQLLEDMIPDTPESQTQSLISGRSPVNEDNVDDIMNLYLPKEDSGTEV